MATTRKKGGRVMVRPNAPVTVKSAKGGKDSIPHTNHIGDSPDSVCTAYHEPLPEVIDFDLVGKE